MAPSQYNMPFYYEYLAKWPDYFVVNESPNGRQMGYSACARRPSPTAGPLLPVAPHCSHCRRALAVDDVAAGVATP